MKKIYTTIAGMMIAIIPSAADTIDLSGVWSIAHSAEDAATATEINLPGSMLTNGIGNNVTTDTKWTGSLYDKSYYFDPRYEKYRQKGNIKFPFFLTPAKEYVGHAEYSRKIDIPADWKKKDITLILERPHIETEVYINGKLAGRDSSLSVPHRFDVTSYIKPGHSNDITIKIYNGIENVCVGQDSHSVTDQTQGNWNGIVGRMELEARPKAHIKNVAVFPRLSDKAIDVKVRLAGVKKDKVDLTLTVDGNEKKYKSMPVNDGYVTLRYPMGDDIRLWDEFTPNLYTLSVSLGDDVVKETFGMREIEIAGRYFKINGRTTYLRGTVENCDFPLTGYPPTDVESWLRVFEKCKDYGLNHVRFHSFCPPEAAFIAADMVGMYLQPEGPSWPNHGVKLGNGMSIDRYLLEETQRMVEEYGNHPSFTMLSAGNEPAGKWVDWVGDFVDYWHSTGDDRRVYCGASVGGGWAWDPKSDYHVKAGARGLVWDKEMPGSSDDFAADMEKVVQKGKKQTLTFDVTEPRVAHEVGQWCVFPDFGEMGQYSGPYKPGNFEIFRESLADNNMADRAENFIHSSGKLQQLAYKYDIERNLRTPNYSGFQLLALNDYSGQGTALVGVLNVLWNEKPYTDKDYWRQFCSPIVPLARFPKFVYTRSDTIVAPVELYNASADELKQVPVCFSITMPDGSVRKISESCADFEIGKNLPVGTLNLPLADMDETGRYTFTVSLGDEASNSWDFWVYPDSIDYPDTSGIYITDTFDEKTEEVLKDGGNVLLLAAGNVKYGNDIEQQYLPVFWNTSWFKMRPPHTTGAYIDTSHPVYADFPTDDWTDLNWWELVNKAQVMNLSQFPAEYQSPMQPIDTWHLNRKLGMIVEGRMHNGKLIMTTLDISSDLDSRPVARQMRRSLLNYITGESFDPQMQLTPDLIYNLYNNTAPRVDMYTNENPDELKPVLK